MAREAERERGKQRLRVRGRLRKAETERGKQRQRGRADRQSDRETGQGRQAKSSRDAN